MCLLRAGITWDARCNWDGDTIIHECIVPSSRPVVGSNRKSQYDIDVREFLVSERNEIMRRTLREKVVAFIRAKGGDPSVFASRTPGCFDYRVDVIAAYVFENIRYKGRPGSDPWQFPDETLFLGTGDCEDRAFLIASLLLASGVSSFNIRVALGKVTTRQGQTRDTHDHVWVMYKNEAGRWTLIEPLKGPESERAARTHSTERAPVAARYEPHFLFNDCHLWAVNRGADSPGFRTYLELRQSWKKWKPKFAGAVHKTILNEALRGLEPGDQWVIDALNRRFSPALYLFGPAVDDIDRDSRNYNPLEHFDNGYVPEGWGLVNQRLAEFRGNNRNLDAFARAAHAIADFYAHSSFAHFARFDAANGRPVLFDPDDPGAAFDAPPSYAPGSSFALQDPPFSINATLWTDQDAKPWEVWAGGIISGRYAQPGDTRPGILNALFLEGPTIIPKALLDAPGFSTRACLPHHDEIAVDDLAPKPAHKLYSGAEYKKQFRWRKNLATAHVRRAFFDHWKT